LNHRVFNFEEGFPLLLVRNYNCYSVHTTRQMVCPFIVTFNDLVADWADNWHG